MQSTTNYGLNIVEGTDIVNPLTQFNPNFTDIDSIMKNNADASIDHATCIKTGTVHAITRTNTDANVFRFTATGNWNTGDTMTVDGVLVSVYVSDGTAPSNNCFVINTEVLASIQGTRVTLYVNSGEASNISFDDTSVSYTATNVQTAIEAASSAAGTEYVSGVSVKDKLDDLISTKYESGAIALNGTYQIPAGALSHKLLNVTLRRYGYADTQVISTADITDNVLSNGVTFTVDNGGVKLWTVSINSTGLITVTKIDSGLGEPIIEIYGLF